ncbi:flagellar hook-length control protein FliK [Sulfitobacter sp. HNIBRBA3233]|uniref:flagellar hook-length control protein FliK n=1 Tax=Sulfitobacter marinivivus TaxID=3158558 RepID=UPI0032DE6E4C
MQLPAKSGAIVATGIVQAVAAPAPPGGQSGEGSSLIATEPMTDLVWEPPRLSQGQTSAAQGAPRPEPAPQVMRQLVDILPSATQKPVEIVMSPRELGRVRLSVARDERNITVQILAERPETLDLMRRHIDQLGQSFRHMGFETISFSFGKGADSGQNLQGGQGDSAMITSDGGATPSADTPTAVTLQNEPSTGLDLRL